VALPRSFCKNQAKANHFKLLYGINTIRLCGGATIEEQGKLSSCYEKNISQSACRKVLLIFGREPAEKGEFSWG
jgi:hypothetical protein